MYEKKEKYSSSHFMLHFKFITEMVCFSFSCILCVLSSKNPFNKIITGDLTTYFEDVKMTTSFVENKKTKKKKFNRYKNVLTGNSIRKKINFRQLFQNSFCSEILNIFIEFEGKKLSNIFDLNYEKIFNISLVNLVISSFLLYKEFFFSFRGKIINKFNKIYQQLFSIFILLLYDLRFLLSIILYFYIEKGDIQTYDDFLKCKNVNTKYFDKVFLNNEYLRKCFLIFFGLNAISLIIYKMERCCEKEEKEIEMKNNI